MINCAKNIISDIFRNPDPIKNKKFAHSVQKFLRDHDLLLSRKTLEDAFVFIDGQHFIFTFLFMKDN